MMRTLGALLFAALLLPACDPAPAMMTNPLVATWKATIRDGTVTMVLKNGGAMDMVLHTEDGTSGCVTDGTLTGTWTSTSTTFSNTLTGGNLATTSCADSSMNETRAAMANETAAYSFSAAPYTISGSTLSMTISGTALAFTKQ